MPIINAAEPVLLTKTISLDDILPRYSLTLFIIDADGSELILSD